MVPCRIKDLKTLDHPDLSETYRRPELHHGPCNKFNEGDSFVVRELIERPKDLVVADWEDLEKISCL